MDFYHKISAKTVGIQYVAIGLALIAIFIGVNAFIYSKEDKVEWIVVLITSIFGIVGLFVTQSGVKHIRFGGYWEITINARGITMNSPHEELDTSYSYPLKDILATQTLRNPGSSDDYNLILKTNELVSLEMEAPCQQVIDALVSFGIENIEHQGIKEKAWEVEINLYSKGVGHLEIDFECQSNDFILLDIEPDFDPTYQNQAFEIHYNEQLVLTLPQEKNNNLNKEYYGIYYGEKPKVGDKIEALIQGKVVLEKTFTENHLKD